MISQDVREVSLGKPKPVRSRPTEHCLGTDLRAHPSWGRAID